MNTGYLLTIKAEVNSDRAYIFLNNEPTRLVARITPKAIAVNESTWVTESYWERALEDSDRLARFAMQLADYAVYKKYVLPLFVRDFV